jgi:hypothetical protein
MRMSHLDVLHWWWYLHDRHRILPVLHVHHWMEHHRRITVPIAIIVTVIIWVILILIFKDSVDTGRFSRQRLLHLLLANCHWYGLGRLRRLLYGYGLVIFLNIFAT